MTHASRPVVSIITPDPVREGAGVNLRRSIGTRTLDHLDPFLLRTTRPDSRFIRTGESKP